MSSRVKELVKETVSSTRNMFDRGRAPPANSRGSQRPGEEEDVGLTTGKAVPRWGVHWVLLACCVALVLAAVGGVLVGVLIVRKNWVDTDPYLRLIPFINIPDAPLNFLVVGDWGRDGQFNQSLVAIAMGKVASSLAADFVVSTGDNFEDDGLRNITDPQFNSSFTAVYTAASLRVPFFAVLGNQDYHQDPTVQLDPALRKKDIRWVCEKNYRRKFKSCPKAQTSFCHSSLEFMFIDTSPLMESYWDPNGPEALNFTGMADRMHGINIELNMLRDGLESSDATWKVVVGHHPVYSTGEHGSTREMQDYILPQLKKFGVDIYMNGHDHNLELIQASDTDTLFVTSGAGSKTGTARTSDVPGSSLFYQDAPGFVSVSVSGPMLDLRFHDLSGAVVYNVTLTKEQRRR